ncbi:MAG: AAA family ATPase [Pseudomonadota bacterium]|nr:AAA family ATPase [Pseudomonadota bacterium]
MVKLRIKNFGPIRYGCENSEGWIEFKKITVFIGDQGTGKSTIAKIFSTFSWLEKAVVKKELDEKIFATKSFFRSKILSYHRIEDYLNDGTVIEYDGEGVYFKYENGELSFSEKEKRYQIPQIMYIPSERNILTFLKNPQDFKMLSGSLLDLLRKYKSSL